MTGICLNPWYVCMPSVRQHTQGCPVFPIRYGTENTPLHSLHTGFLSDQEFMHTILS